MNFTREPIIETILSPKDGYKLCIKNSKVAESEELFVDVVEVVSFGHAFFFRGQERPKPFLVPVSDYEIFEVKETRVVLKNVAYERNIKIGGGRDSFAKPVKEPLVKELEEAVEEEIEDKEEAGAVPKEGKAEKKRERRRNRRKKQAEERKEKVGGKFGEDSDEEEAFVEDGDEIVESSLEEKTVYVVPLFAQLLPPPTTLISESIARMKAEAAKAEAAAAVEVTVPAEEIDISSEFLD